MKRLLVTGGSGLVGSNLLHAFRGRYNVMGTFYRFPYRPPGIPMIQTDFGWIGSVEAALDVAQPEVIVHTAAATPLDWCETHPREAREVNVEGTRNLVVAAAKRGSKIVMISTDSVFDGTAPPYEETDRSNPVNVYARSKLDSEEPVLALPGGLVVRTTLFGWNVRPKPDLAERTVLNLEKGQPVMAFADLRSSPILANDFATLLAAMVDRDLFGTFHVCGRDPVSKLEFSRRTAEVFGLDPRLVLEGRSADARLPAKRPPDTTLRVEKIERELGRPMPPLVEGLQRMRDLRRNGYLAQLRAGCPVPESVGRPE